MTARNSATYATGTVNLLAIASDNSWLHVFPNLATLLQNDDIGADGDARGGMEFFDREARRLVPVFSRTWQLLDLVPTDDKPDPDGLQRRLTAVVAHLEAYLDQHRTTVEPQLKRYGLTPDDAIARLPRLDATSYPDSLGVFVPVAADPDEDDGDWMHNFMHRCGWTHD